MHEDINDVLEEYIQLTHAMQSGVAMTMNYDSKATEPKHLRVGVNSAMSAHKGLVELLIKKGLISQEEYYVAMRDAMRHEVQSYEKELSDRLHTKITLK